MHTEIIETARYFLYNTSTTLINPDNVEVMCNGLKKVIPMYLEFIEDLSNDDLIMIAMNEACVGYSIMKDKIYLTDTGIHGDAITGTNDSIIIGSSNSNYTNILHALLEANFPEDDPMEDIKESYNSIKSKYETLFHIIGKEQYSSLLHNTQSDIESAIKEYWDYVCDIYLLDDEIPY